MLADPAPLRALAARLETATPDECGNGGALVDTLLRAFVTGSPHWWVHVHGNPLTDLQAAVDLCELVLPGASWQVQRYHGCSAIIIPGDFELIDAEARTPALALCVAIVRAELART